MNSMLLSLVFRVVLLINIGCVYGLVSDTLIKLDPEIRYGLATDDLGRTHTVDLWLTLKDLLGTARYDPYLENQYHLFTRANPSVSQPLVINNPTVLATSNYDRNKRTAFVIHGWYGSAVAEINAVIVPAFLAGGDVNVIVVDWSAGAVNPNYSVSLLNSISSGVEVGSFINWLISTTEGDANEFHIVGHSLGGHQAGIAARYSGHDIGYVTSLDPALPGWETNLYRFNADDGLYTEVIHTDIGIAGFVSELGHVDFYPNGGTGMPGCSSQSCDHDRCYFYFAESLQTGGFTGWQCSGWLDAAQGSCSLPGTLHMGGLLPKSGARGVFYLETNANTPFSQG